MGRVILLYTTIFALLLTGCSQSPTVQSEKIKTKIVQTLEAQDAAWNAGDIDGFMQTYWKSDKLRFASGGHVRRGWQATLDGYKKRYPDKAAMGQLSFTDLEIDVLSDDAALVFGRWELKRANDNPGGLFTLLMRKLDGEWKIVSDHTSAGEN